MNLSELHKLSDLLVVQRAVLSVVLADEVLWEETDPAGGEISFTVICVHVLISQYANKPMLLDSRKIQDKKL